MNEKKNRVLYYISFMILMIALGCSDALRGVFAPVFNTYFNLDGASVSLLITVSYLGNFVFMLFGSKIADRLGVKMVFILGLFIWIGALLIYILTNSYIAIVVGVFFALGSSTLPYLVSISFFSFTFQVSLSLNLSGSNKSPILIPFLAILSM